MKAKLTVLAAILLAACNPNSSAPPAASAPVASVATASDVSMQAASVAVQVDVQAASAASEVVATEKGDVAALVQLLNTFQQEIDVNGRQAADITNPEAVKVAALKEVDFFKAQTQRLVDLKLDGRAAQLRDKMVRSRQLSAEAITVLLTQPQAKSDPRYAKDLEESNRLQEEVLRELQTLAQK